MKEKNKRKETTSFQQFRGSIDFLQTHMQLIDASLIQSIRTLRKHSNKEDDISVALGVSPTKYGRLNHPTKQHPAIFKHTQRKNIEFSIIQLYNIFSAYLLNLTHEMFDKDPMFVVGKAIITKEGDDKELLNMSYAEIIRHGKMETIHSQIVKKIFRGIEEQKSTMKLLDRILKDTKVNISTKMRNDALTYLEMRHLFIHNRGKVDVKYSTSFGDNFTPKLHEGDDLPTVFETFSNGMTKIVALCAEIDKQIIEAGFAIDRH